MSRERDPDKVLSVLEHWGKRLELNRIERLLAVLGSPEESYANVLVAGTNGKGSTASLLASMATSAGYRTGLFTSPHLETVEERLRLDGRAIERSDLAAVLEELLARADEARIEMPTYFEALTAAAFLWFARTGVELAIFEVGMGGRLDATNACTPVLSVISEIGLDHTKHLGDTLEAIALEKAGILRAGVPVVSGASSEEARRALRGQARDIGAPWREVRENVSQVRSTPTRAGQRVEVVTGKREYTFSLGLRGQHQVRNLLLASSAAEVLEAGDWPGFERRSIERGVSRSRWPGRLERIGLPGGRVVWLDAAHNPQGAERLGEFLALEEAEYDLLFGVLGGKDAAAVLSPVARQAARIALTRPPSDRSQDPAGLTRWVGDVPARVYQDPEEALDSLLDETRPLVVCGSLYLVGWARGALRRRFGRPSPAADPLFAGGPRERSNARRSPRKRR